MEWTPPWWRKVGMVLAALVLTVLTLGPGLDGLICRDEGSLSAVAAELPVAAAPADDAGPPPLDEGRGICIHGHCHHSAPYVPATLAAGELSAPLLAVAHPFVRNRVPISDPKFGLIRPPRA